MKQLSIIGGCLLGISLLFSACNEKGGVFSSGDSDSIALENQRLNEFLDIIAYSLDSINGQERYLLQDQEGKVLTNKAQIRNNLRIFQNTINEQRSRIAELEAQLKDLNERSRSRLQSVIKTMQAQLDEKDALIANLQQELEKKNADIAALQSSVNQLNTQVGELTEESKQKDVEIASARKEAENQSAGYVLIDTKKNLSAKGVLTGGFLKKKKVDFNNADNAKFQQVDIRTCQGMSIPGKNPKVLTPQPSSSYTIEETSNGAALRITNASQFWGASRYVIVQYK